MTGSISDFFTREQANEGIKLPLVNPDGSATEHWIRIRSVDSDEFRHAKRSFERAVFKLTQSESEGEDQAIEKEEDKLLASLIIDWSMSEKCNEENKLDLIAEAPQIADQIERIANKRSMFIKKKSEDSSKSPSDNSN